jgi:formylglycine-generating enzyme required for sulfatase activity
MLTHIRNAALGALAVLALAAPATAQSCDGDLDGNGVINGADLGSLLDAWGACVSCAADLNDDGAVNGADLGTMLTNWEACQINTPSWATLVQARPDPAVVTDPTLLAAIEATGLAWRVLDTATQVELLLVPPGTFQMGCVMGANGSGCFATELPVHQVTLTNAFYLGRYEVTQSQWVAQMGSNPSYFQGLSDSASRPVEQVSWIMIQDYLGATGFRLPTEAEWEYACRAGTQTPFHSGPGFPNGTTDPDLLIEIAWWGCASGCSTKPVGSRAPNAFGFHDMLGNVWEVVRDWHSGYTAEAQTNPTGPERGVFRVYRGGSWYPVWPLPRSSVRPFEPPSYPQSAGFRVARNP